MWAVRGRRTTGYMTDVDLAPSPTEQLVDRIFGASLATLELLSVHLDWRLDLYRLLADNGPQRLAELAERSGIDGRYAREWLEQQATAGFLTVDDVGLGADDRRYACPPSTQRCSLIPRASPTSPRSRRCSGFQPDDHS